jgi:hypothetical protein
MIKILLATLICTTFFSCASNNKFRSFASSDKEESSSLPKVMITSLDLKTPILIEAANKKLGKVVEPNVSNILQETLVVGSDRRGYMSVNLSCDWPIKRAENPRSIKADNRETPLSIISIGAPIMSVQTGTREETKGALWYKEVVRTDLFDDRQFLIMHTTLASSPVIKCKLIPEGEGLAGFSYSMTEWVEPREVEELFLKNGFIIRIPEYTLNELIE